MGEGPLYRDLADEKFRAGIKAQLLFKQQAIEHGLMVEAIAQDQGSFKPYTPCTNNFIKRGDFLLRNAGHIEIETKCLTYCDAKGFYLPYRQIMGHREMQVHSKSPVVVAIYERNGDCPVADSLRMIHLDVIQVERNRPDAITYDETTKCFVVPLG